MGDVGDDFKAWQEHKAEQRAKIEPKRFAYAHAQLHALRLQFSEGCDKIVIELPRGTVTFYPFTGWFQGQKPYGAFRGRGIGHLISKLRGVGK